TTCRPIEQQVAEGGCAVLIAACRRQAQLQGYLGESGALLVLWKVLDAELVKEHAQMGLHGVQAQAQLIGDLLVARRARVGTRVLVLPAQRDQQRSLRLRSE